MRNVEKLWNRLADSADLSDEAMPGQMIVEVTGAHRILIENHCGVNQYESNRIVVNGKKGDLVICGQDLVLTKMSKESLIIKGCIQQISLPRRG